MGNFVNLKSTFLAGALAATSVVALSPAVVAAQEAQRLDRIEAQLRALQRQVFPGGDQRYFEPEITPSAVPQTQPNPVGTPSTTAMTDALARLDAIEAQLARLTAASEVNANALAELEARLDAAGIGVAGAMPSVPAASTQGQPTGVIQLPGSQPTVTVPTSTPAASAPASATSGPTPERVAAVSDIAKPATDDAGDDEYSYGYRLWEAKFYPEAQQQLTMFLEKYPAHWRTTYGRNLLGRAYLDAGDARRAATFFFENYQSDKQAARAPDSLLFLAESMVKLGDTNRACIALAEFGDTYPALATGRLQLQYDDSRSRVDCK